MKILVCVKVIKGEINPFDESALECALRLSDDVTVVSMGAVSTANALKPLTRLGAKVILLSDTAYAGSDTLATSYVLSTAINNMEYDLILCGRQSIDGDTAQVGPMLSEMLGCSLITNALSVSAHDGNVFAQTRDGSMQAALPSLVTVERGYVLRFPSILSKAGDIKIIDNSGVGCDVSRCGLAGSPTKVLKSFENTRGRRKCEFIRFSELLPLIDKLNQEPPKVKTQQSSGIKLKTVWAIGDEVYPKAAEIAQDVIVIDKLPPAEIARKAKEEKPEVILWNADLWGRKNAPVVAAMLGTGLCADCTMLETDGEKLFMYRPAQGGNITAKIECVTLPQMATVRTVAPSFDIIVAGGRGVIGKMDKLTDFAGTLNAQLAASRALVDAGKAAYELQVGLTGRTVSPKIYIAVGISGAIHHTCAIENAEFVIAVNNDKNARIFEYADYGITEEF